MNRTLTGQLLVSSHGDYAFEYDDGSLEIVYLPGDCNIPPTNTRIALTVDKNNIIPNENNHELLPSPPAAPLTHINFGLFFRIPLDYPEKEKIKDLARVQDYARQTENYARRYAGLVWEIRAEGFIYESESSNVAFPHYGKADIQPFIDAGGTNGFIPTHHMAIGYGRTDRCGEAVIGGNWGATFRNMGCGIGTIVHELFGHELGFDHAGQIKPDGSETEYRDDSDIMGGGGGLLTGLSSPRLVQMGFETNREIKYVDSSQAILIAAVERTHHMMHPGMYQHVILVVAGQPNWILSTRNDKGWPYSTGSNRNDTLYAHRIDKGGKTKRLLPDIKVGETKMLPNRVYVTYHEYAEETASVSALFPDQGTVSQPLPIPTGFPARMKSVQIQNSHTGMWHDPRFVGQGLNVFVDVERGEVMVYWFAYNEKYDDRRWWTGHGKISDGQATFELRTTDKGTFDDPTKHESYVVGEGQLYFHDGESGVFCFDTDEHGKGSFNLIPSAPLSDSPLSGSFYSEETDGSGVIMFVMESINRAVAFFYTYGGMVRPHRPGSSDRAIQKQRWILCHGERVSAKGEPDKFRLVAIETKGGKWMSFDRPTEVNIGAAILTFIPPDDLKINPNNVIEWEYDLKGVKFDSDGVRTETMGRIF